MLTMNNLKSITPTIPYIKFELASIDKSPILPTKNIKEYRSSIEYKNKQSKKVLILFVQIIGITNTATILNIFVRSNVGIKKDIIVCKIAIAMLISQLVLHKIL